MTVPFSKATSNGAVSAANLAQIGSQNSKVYQQTDYVGSLVVESKTGRPTEHAGPKVQPPGWWDTFWQWHFENTGQMLEEAIIRLDKLLGTTWAEQPVETVEAALRQAQSSR